MSFEETHDDLTTQTQDAAAEQQPETQHAEQAAQPATDELHQPAPAASEAAAVPAPHRGEKEPGPEDFASALESFEQEQAQTEAALNEEQVITATVLKVTPQYVLVDIGYKSEGVVPVSEFTDHEGNVTIQRGDEIAVMREPGSSEEGYINLSHQKAQRLRSWDEIDKAFNEKSAVKARVIDRIKGGLTVDIMGARASFPVRRLICVRCAISRP